jgi:hypothetical protein
MRYIVCTVQSEDVIKDVGVRDDLDETNATNRLTRKEVIDQIEDGETFYTAYKSNGVLKKGQLIQIFLIGGVKYLKTKANNLKRDNLDNLRECKFK